MTENMQKFKEQQKMKVSALTETKNSFFHRRVRSIGRLEPVKPAVGFVTSYDKAFVSRIFAVKNKSETLSPSPSSSIAKGTSPAKPPVKLKEDSQSQTDPLFSRNNSMKNFKLSPHVSIKHSEASFVPPGLSQTHTRANTTGFNLKSAL